MLESVLTATAPASLPPGRYGNPDKDGVVLRPIEGGSLVCIQTGHSQVDELAAVIQSAFGVDLPRAPLLTRGPGLSLLWSGRLQWFAMSPDSNVLERLALLRRLASLSDQSDARCVVEISGPKARETLAKLAPIDLHPRAFGKNATALTVFGHMSGQITQTGDEPLYQVMVFRSFAESFWTSLVEAGSEYGVRIDH